MKNKYARKDKKVKKSKSPKNAKKIVSKKKQTRKAPVVVEPPITLGFESSASEPIEPEALVDLAADVIPGDPTEAV